MYTYVYIALYVYCNRVMFYLYRSVYGIRARKIYVATYVNVQQVVATLLFRSECHVFSQHAASMQPGG